MAGSRDEPPVIKRGIGTGLEEMDRGAHYYLKINLMYSKALYRSPNHRLKMLGRKSTTGRRRIC